jgi:hypothetical protein
MDARRRNASAVRLRFSKSFASRRHLPSQPKLRSTTHRFGRITKPFAASDRFTISKRFLLGHGQFPRRHICRSDNPVRNRADLPPGPEGKHSGGRGNAIYSPAGSMIVDNYDMCGPGSPGRACRGKRALSDVQIGIRRVKHVSASVEVTPSVPPCALAISWAI